MNFNQLTKDISNRPAQKKLSDLINDLPVVQVSGPMDVGVKNIVADSRKVEDRSIFIALEGAHDDGHKHVQKAIECGASAVVVQLRQYERDLRHLLSTAYSQHNQTVVIIVEDTRKAFAHLADRFYDSPSKKLRLIGITGTNGKTTTSFLVKSILEQTGEKVGLIGTIGYYIGENFYEAQFTPPFPDQLHRLFHEMVQAKCTSVVMEVSSHSLALQRIHGLTFEVALFTNLTQDHLDFHGTIENYRDAKKLLFDCYTRSFSIFNGDDQSCEILSQDTSSKKIFYGFKPTNDVIIQDMSLEPSSTRIQLQTMDGVTEIHSSLTGQFNVYNIAAASSVGYTLRIRAGQIVNGIEAVKSIRGRFEKMISNRDVTAIVDYSHTPDSLQKCLETIGNILVRKNSQDKIITVFGCGGDRDKEKRPLMGKIAQDLSDVIIVTSDNPRSEDPQAIINEIMHGISRTPMIHSIVDRREAIHYALSIAASGDVVLVAGKGHETYQIIGDQKNHFDDREVIEKYFKQYHDGVKI